MEKIIVVFRKNKNGTIFALFPYIYIKEDYAGFYCLSYAHIGQHSGAQYIHCISTSKPAKPDEYADLKRELESIGYDLIVKQKINYKYFKTL